MTAKSAKKSAKPKAEKAAGQNISQSDVTSHSPKKPSAKAAAAPAANSQGIARSVGPEYYFFVVDGRPLKNLLELADAMEEMTDEAFSHHVTETKNDFAKWVHDVFDDEELAIKLGQSKTRHHHQLVILKHLVRRLLP
jgi:hypothetical protein